MTEATNDMSAGASCPNCGRGKLTPESITHDLGPLLGLVKVTIGNLPVLKCDQCAAVLVPGEILEHVSMAITGEMLTRAELDPIDVRFLRKALGYTQQELAKHLGADRVTVNRWENGSGPIDGMQSYALRSHVFMKLRSQAGPLFDAGEQALREEPIPGPHSSEFKFPDAKLLGAA